MMTFAGRSVSVQCANTAFSEQSCLCNALWPVHYTCANCRLSRAPAKPLTEEDSKCSAGPQICPINNPELEH